MMSNNKFSWANLNNTDTINLTKNEEYNYTTFELGNDGEHINLMNYENLTTTNTYDFEDNNGMYDNLCATAKIATNAYPRAGNYYAFKICCNNFKTGNIKKLNFVCAPARGMTDIANKATKLVVGLIQNNVITIKSHFELENSYDETICGKALLRRLYAVTPDTEENLIITKELINDPNAGIIIIVLGINETFADYDVNTIISQDALLWQSDYSNPDTGKYSVLRVVSYFRPLYDTCSYCYQPSGSGSLIDYIPVLDYDIVIDVIDDHIVSNFDTYHMSRDEINELGYTKYSAPFINNSLKNNIKNICFESFKISHDSLSRNQKFDLNYKNISEILIPFNARKTWENTTYQNYYTKGIDNNGENDDCPRFTPMYLEVALEEPTDNTVWYRSDNAISQNAQREINLPNNQTTDSNITYLWRWTFNNNPIQYSGTNGIWVRVISASLVHADKHLNQLTMSYYTDATSENDYFVASYTTQQTTEGVTTYTPHTEQKNIVPPVKVLFDYQLRLDWYDYIESKLEDLEKALNSSS